MRNKILSLTRNVIPYVKELRIFTDSVVGCILMQQLDYWFERYPSGFYKFLEPSEHPKYVQGQSWQEEIGVSVAEFRTAFDRIGTRWKSKTEFEQAIDKFQGKLYASYQDKRENLTFYFRNHLAVDAALDSLVASLDKKNYPNGGEGRVIQGVRMASIQPSNLRIQSASRVNEEAQSPGDAETQSPVDVESESLEIEKLNLQEIKNLQLDNTEITFTEITSEKLLQQDAGHIDIETKEQNGSSLLISPTGLTTEELNSLKAILRVLQVDTAQKVCDEIAGLRKSGRVKVSALALAAGLVKKCQANQFIPAAGMAIAAERKKAVLEVVQPTKPKTTSKSQPIIPLRDRLSKAGINLRFNNGTA